MSKSQLANAAVSGPPIEWPPQKTFRARTRRFGIPAFSTAYQSFIVWASPTCLSHAACCGVTQPANRLPSIGLLCQ
ncbi:MAG: hypothetical protein E6G49_06050 [Actinobacteria bacterium]|nr:MAG: hypothetical protein E6G49_06050 [Actinomycetota bacterium]